MCLLHWLPSLKRLLSGTTARLDDADVSKRPATHIRICWPAATGRAVAFFSFYFIDGVLIGFMGIFLAMRMRSRNVAVDDIALFVAAVYLPASWKWLFGPLVDLCYIERFGRRRGWILGTEALMIVALLAAMRIDFARQFTLFTIVMMLVNLFAALQRIAVNALACNVLTDQERGTANGMMYAGGYLGQIVGGSGVILLSAFVPFPYLFLVVVGSILAVMLFVALPLREAEGSSSRIRRSRGLAAVAAEVRGYAIQAFNAFRASRAALVGLVFVLLPAGAWAMSLSLGTNLMVEFGMSKREQSLLTFVSILVAAAASLVGGLLADRFGRRKTLALYIVGRRCPRYGMAYVMYQRGWIMPIDQNAAVHPIAPLLLIVSYWAVALLHQRVSGIACIPRARRSSWIFARRRWPRRNSPPMWRWSISPSFTRPPGRAGASRSWATRRLSPSMPCWAWSVCRYCC